MFRWRWMRKRKIKMENKITLQDIDRRLAALERAVATMTAEKNGGEHSDELRGRFAHIGGIERPSAHSSEGSQRIDFSEAYGETGKRILRFEAIFDEC